MYMHVCVYVRVRVRVRVRYLLFEHSSSKTTVVDTFEVFKNIFTYKEPVQTIFTFDWQFI